MLVPIARLMGTLASSSCGFFRVSPFLTMVPLLVGHGEEYRYVDQKFLFQEMRRLEESV